MIARAAIVAQARQWIGTPYHHQARARGIGVDCAGLLIGVARELGLVDATFDVGGYARRPDGASLLSHCEQRMVRVSRDEMQPGDAIVMRFDIDPQHIGIVGDWRGGGLSMIHARGTRDGRGKVIEHRLDAWHLQRFVAAFRLPGVEA